MSQFKWGKKHKLPRKVIQLLLCAKMHLINCSICQCSFPSKKRLSFLFGPLCYLVFYVSIVTQVQIAEEIRPILKWRLNSRFHCLAKQLHLKPHNLHWLVSPKVNTSQCFVFQQIWFLRLWIRNIVKTFWDGLDKPVGALDLKSGWWAARQSGLLSVRLTVMSKPSSLYVPLCD